MQRLSITHRIDAILLTHLTLGTGVWDAADADGVLIGLGIGVEWIEFNCSGSSHSLTSSPPMPERTGVSPSATPHCDSPPF
jgi:hypothetical protein